MNRIVKKITQMKALNKFHKAIKEIQINKKFNIK